MTSRQHLYSCYFSFGIQYRLHISPPLKLDIILSEERVWIYFHETIHPLFGGGPFCDFSISSIIAWKTSRTAYKQRTVMFSNSISLSLLFSNRFMTGKYFRNIVWVAVVSNSFVPNAALRFSNVFRGVEKGCIGNKWVNMFLSEVFLLTFYPTLPCWGLREHDISYALLRLLVHACTTKKREL